MIEPERHGVELLRWNGPPARVRSPRPLTAAFAAQTEGPTLRCQWSSASSRMARGRYSEDDRISLVGLSHLVPGQPVECRVTPADGTTEVLQLAHSVRRVTAAVVPEGVGAEPVLREVEDLPRIVEILLVTGA